MGHHDPLDLVGALVDLGDLRVAHHPLDREVGGVAANAEADVQLSEEIDALRAIFERIAQKAAVVDPTLEKAVRADATKAVGTIEQWESRLVRAEKQKHEVTVNQIRALREKLFPGGGLQERHDNFMPYLLKYGDGWLDTLKAHLRPFEAGVAVLEDLG